jgi:hypothetical protein
LDNDVFLELAGELKESHHRPDLQIKKPTTAMKIKEKEVK